MSGKATVQIIWDGGSIKRNNAQGASDIIVIKKKYDTYK